jgi:hypothetical protein
MIKTPLTAAALVVAALLATSHSAWSLDSSPSYTPTVDCELSDNRKCLECDYSGTDAEACCRDPKNCEIKNKPLPPIVALTKPPKKKLPVAIQGTMKAAPEKSVEKPTVPAPQKPAVPVNKVAPPTAPKSVGAGGN